MLDSASLAHPILPQATPMAGETRARSTCFNLTSAVPALALLGLTAICLAGVWRLWQQANSITSALSVGNADWLVMADAVMQLLTPLQVMATQLLVTVAAAATLGLLATAAVMRAHHTAIRRLRRIMAVLHRLGEGQRIDYIPCLADADEVGDMARAIAVFRADAEEITLRGLELEEAHALFDAALSNMAHGLLMLDQDLRVVLCNAQMKQMFGYDPDIVRPGMTMAQLLAHSIERGNHPGMTMATMQAAITARIAARSRATYQFTLPGDRLINVQWVPMANGGWVCTYEDVTAREQAAARVAYMATHDPITGLPNRGRLHESIAECWRRGEQGPLNLLCVAIDRFEALCDTRGHRRGDLLLQNVAIRLAGCVRVSDTVAHLGGPTFAILQSGASTPQAAAVLAERIIEAMQEPLMVGGHKAMATVSIGVARAQPPAEAQTSHAAEELLRNATLALHRATQDGGGSWRLFGADMDRSAKARDAMELDLRQALGLGQFELYYQPLVGVQTRRVCAFEALLRWRHPTRGMVSPAQFIPLAEELGLIGEIGAWVLRTACAEAASWPDSVAVAVNLSPLQFAPRQGTIQTLPEVVAEALTESGLPGHRLELEITESVRLQEDSATLAVLHSLRNLGARISLDDFGTGYSSLSYLRSFPFDKLKIDQSFVRSLPDPGSAAIVRAIAALGASLGITVVAEGIETQAQLHALVAEHCDEMQGYLFNPPRPACDVPALLLIGLDEVAA